MPRIGPRAERADIPAVYDVSKADLIKNAGEALANLKWFGWPDTWPERPEGLTFDDLELYHANRKVDRGERLGKEETDQLKLFATWRSAVLNVESSAVGRLQTLMGLINTLEAEDRGKDAARVRKWIRQQFRCEVPIPCPHRAEAWTRRFCEHFGRNFTLMPVHLRKGTKPPDTYQPPAPPQQSFTQFAEDD